MPKKRDHGSGGLYYVESEGLYRAVVDVGFWPNGRRRQKTVRSKTRRGAQQKLADLRKEIDTYGAPLDRAMTVEAWAKHWLETVCRPKMKPKPYSAYRSNVNVWVIPIIGKKRVSMLKPSDLRTIYKAITDAGRSSTTALKVHNLMSAMLESARLDGIVGRNVARDVVPPKAAVSNRDALPMEAAFAVLRAAAGHVDGTRWWVALLAGMRQGERIGATIDSLDLDRVDPRTGEPAPLFTVQWSLTEAKFEHRCGPEPEGKEKWPCGRMRAGSCPDRRLIIADGLDYKQLDGRLCLVRPKNGKPRTFPLIPQLAEALKRYLIATKDVPNPHGLIWRNADGSPLTATQDNEAWRALLLEAGVITEEQAKEPKDRAIGTPDTPTTHWARHTTATVLMELGVDAKVIGEIVGHASTQITQRYQHVSSTAAEAAMAAIGSHFREALA